MLARKLSVRDIEDAFRDENGRLLLSKTTVRPRRCTKSKSCASRLFTTLAYDPMHGRPRVLLADDRLAVVTPSVSQTGIGHAKSFPRYGLGRVKIRPRRAKRNEFLPRAKACAACASERRRGTSAVHHPRPHMMRVRA